MLNNSPSSFSLPNIVWVLPAPVYPKAKIVKLKL